MFIITNDLVTQMLNHARAGYPNEVCGLVGGPPNQGCVVRAITNIATPPTVRYQMDPEEQLQAFEAFDEQGLDLTAIYHSHPRGPGQPSPTDIAESYYPGTVYLIINMARPNTPSISAWIIVERQATPVEWAIVTT